MDAKNKANQPLSLSVIFLEETTVLGKTGWVGREPKKQNGVAVGGGGGSGVKKRLKKNRTCSW